MWIKSIFLFNQEKFKLRVFNIFSNDKEFFLTYIDRILFEYSSLIAKLLYDFNFKLFFAIIPDMIELNPQSLNVPQKRKL